MVLGGKLNDFVEWLENLVKFRKRSILLDKQSIQKMPNRWKLESTSRAIHSCQNYLRIPIFVVKFFQKCRIFFAGSRLNEILSKLLPAFWRKMAEVFHDDPQNLKARNFWTNGRIRGSAIDQSWRGRSGLSTGVKITPTRRIMPKECATTAGVLKAKIVKIFPIFPIFSVYSSLKPVQKPSKNCSATHPEWFWGEILHVGVKMG